MVKKLLTLVFLAALGTSTFAAHKPINAKCGSIGADGTIYHWYVHLSGASKLNGSDYIMWDGQKYTLEYMDNIGNTTIVWSKSFTDTAGEYSRLGLALENGRFYAVSMNPITNKITAGTELICQEF